DRFLSAATRQRHIVIHITLVDEGLVEAKVSVLEGG
ncbi:hypothetical protein CCACVL1_21614, partial [Corchorus capsularis]